MPVEVKVGDKIVTAPMTDNTGRIKVGDTVPVIVDPVIEDPASPALSGRLRGLEEGR